MAHVGRVADGLFSKAFMVVILAVWMESNGNVFVMNGKRVLQLISIFIWDYVWEKCLIGSDDLDKRKTCRQIDCC